MSPINSIFEMKDLQFMSFNYILDPFIITRISRHEKCIEQALLLHVSLQTILTDLQLIILLLLKIIMLSKLKYQIMNQTQ